jgi:hypothetical protein
MKTRRKRIRRNRIGASLAKKKYAASAAGLAAEISRLYKEKPRPIVKRFGPHPTDEQLQRHKAEEKAWNAANRKTRAAHKNALERDNAKWRKENS